MEHITRVLAVERHFHRWELPAKGFGRRAPYHSAFV